MYIEIRHIKGLGFIKNFILEGKIIVFIREKMSLRRAVSVRCKETIVEVRYIGVHALYVQKFIIIVIDIY